MNDPNPDYKLVEIHAANIGYQAKCNLINGSYLIYGFTQRLKQDTLKRDKDKKSLATMFEEMQNELHDKGRQQTINTFNNNTRHLIFRKNKFETIKSIEMSENMLLPTDQLIMHRMSTPDGYLSVDINNSDDGNSKDCITTVQLTQTC